LPTTGDNALYYHRNQQYSIVGLTNAAGTLVERYTYSAYGTLGIYAANGTVRSSSTYANRYTYTGREWDSELRLYHFRARWYDPATGGFVSRDPLGYVDGMSLYRGYFGVDGVDPSGKVLLHEGAHYRCPSHQEYLRIQAEERSGPLQSSGTVSRTLPTLWDRIRRQLLLCCLTAKELGLRELVQADCPYFYHEGKEITCEAEVENIIQRLKDTMFEISRASGTWYWFRPVFCNPTHAVWEHGAGPFAGYYCDQCASAFMTKIGRPQYFNIENVRKGITLSTDFGSHSWVQIRCNADGRVYGQIDTWADFGNPWRNGKDQFGYFGANYDELERTWRGGVDNRPNGRDRISPPLPSRVPQTVSISIDE
jgi:RHS repeat-associated protein